MNGKEKIRAFREALKEAQEVLDFYKGYIETAEDFDTKDTSELVCLGGFFNWLPQCGYEPTAEETEEEARTFLERAKSRAERKAKERAYNKEQKELNTTRYYAVKFYHQGEDPQKVAPFITFGVRYRGKKSDLTAYDLATRDNLELKALPYKVEELSEAEYIASVNR